VARPWETVESVATPEGRLELRRRGPRDFLIVVDGRVVMTSAAHESEEELARLACAAIAGRARPKVLIGGLGMGFTLRAALDALPAAARVTVAEINAVVAAWCRGPLAPLTGAAAADPRVEVVVEDVDRVIARARALDAIVLDLYEGPYATGDAALRRARAALAAGGVLAVWSEERDAGFERRLSAAGFTAECRRVGGRGARRHVVYVGRP
jgi:spermidine synthase